MTRLQKFAAAIASLALAGGIVLSATAPSFAQRPTEEQMLNALRPAPKTRGLTTDSRQDEQRFIDSVRKIKTRQLTLNEREKVFQIADKKPKIDLEIYFGYNSAEISADAEAELTKLGRVALRA